MEDQQLTRGSDFRNRSYRAMRKSDGPLFWPLKRDHHVAQPG